MSTDKWYGAGGRFRNKIYVGNLSSRTKESDIRTAFSDCGPVADIILKYDFAFVEMENERDIQPAIELILHFIKYNAFFIYINPTHACLLFIVYVFYF